MISSTSPGTSGSPSALYVRLLSVARLALEREVADHRDRPRRLVGALRAPGGDRGVVECAVDAEVEPDVRLSRPAALAPPGRERRAAFQPAATRRSRALSAAGRRADDGDRRPLVRGARRNAERRRARVDAEGPARMPGARSRGRGPTRRRRSSGRRREPARALRAFCPSASGCQKVASCTVEPAGSTISGAFCGT